MSSTPFRVEQIEELAVETYVDQVLDLAEKIRTVREAVRKDADTLDRRMGSAGYVRRLWKQTEEDLPALMSEARAAQWTISKIANTLDVTESYVYRRLREQQAE
ncbi:hypothetical protein [Streptomyces sp. NPDC004685]